MTPRQALVFAALLIAALLCYAAAFGWAGLSSPIEAGFLFLGGVAFTLEALRRLPA